MGAWGAGIRSDDTVLDVLDTFREALKDGLTVDNARKQVIQKFQDQIADTDDGPSFWIGLAEIEWTYGISDPEALANVFRDYTCGASVAAFSDDPPLLARRRTAILAFIDKISMRNPKPAKFPKLIVRPPKLKAGTCLAVKLQNGQYGAALVTAADHTRPEYGYNLIVTLDYMSPEKPDTGVCIRRNWLILNHHNYNNQLDAHWYGSTGFGAGRSKFEIVGMIDILPGDPSSSSSYSSWAHIASGVVYQREWDENQGRV